MRVTERRALFLTLLLTGCQFSSPNTDRGAPAQGVAADDVTPGLKASRAAAGDAAGLAETAPPSPPDGGAVSPAVDPAVSPAMIIRTGQASVEVDSLEIAVAQLRSLAQRLGGFIANSQLQSGANQLRSATLEIKVPASRFEELSGGLSPIGKIEYVTVSAEDVGEEFSDVSARIANARRLEQRLIDLLTSRTGRLSDVLEIERELARVREGIERMEGRLRYLKAHAATSTLAVTVHERAPLVGEQGSGRVLGEAFRQAWRNFVGFVASAIASLGVLAPVAALGIAAFLGLRALWRRRQPR